MAKQRPDGQIKGKEVKVQAAEAGMNAWNNTGAIWT